MKQKNIIEIIDFCERRSRGLLEKRHLLNLLKIFEYENRHNGSHIITITDNRLKDFFDYDTKYRSFKRINNGKIEINIPLCNGSKNVKTVYVKLLCSFARFILEQKNN